MATKKAARKKSTTRKKSTARKTTAKKSTARKKVSRKPVTAIGVNKGSVAQTGTLEFAASNRSSVYDDMFASLKKLKPGQSYLIPVPKDATPDVLHNRLSAAFRRGGVQDMAPKGYMFCKQTTADQKSIAVSLYPTE